jgi:hypothetical protein
MKKRRGIMHRRALIICGIILLISTAAVLAYERDDFLFLSEIEIGMQGIGKTVVAGDVISEFEVEVLGVVNEPKTRADFIVVRVSGEAINRSRWKACGSIEPCCHLVERSCPNWACYPN